MHNGNRWIAGIAVRSFSHDMSGIWIIRRVNGSKVTFANIDDQSVVVKSDEELEERLASKHIQFLAEDRYNGEIVFQDLSEKDQEETVRKYTYTKAYLETEDKKRSKRKLARLIDSVAEAIGDNEPPAWNTFNNWLNQYFSAGERIKGLYPNHSKKGCRIQRMNPKIYQIIDDVMPFYFKASQMLPSTIHRMVEAKILKHNLDNLDDTLSIPAYSTVANHIKRRVLRRLV